MTFLPDHQPETFHLDNLAVTLNRITDEQFGAFWRRSIAIKEDGLFQMVLMKDRNLDFARMHFLLQSLYGPSGKAFDDYKASFSFPFALEVARVNRAYAYSLEVRNYRTWLEFNIRRGVASAAQADNFLHEPLADEFPRGEINDFIVHFYRHLEGKLAMLMKLKPLIQPFVYCVRSNLVLYGYRDGAFFERRCVVEDVFTADLAVEKSYLV